MKSNHLRNSIAFVMLLIFFPYVNVVSQGKYFVPSKIPKASYTLELDFDFQSGILEGQGSVAFCNEGKWPIEIIAFDYALNNYQLLRLKQGNRELDVFSPDGNAKLNNPVYFILDKPVLKGDSMKLEMEFKRRLFTDENPDEFDQQNLIPRLWWDGISISEAFNIKLNELPGYTVAVSGRQDPETGYYKNDNVLNFGFFFSKKCSVIEDVVEGVLVRVIYPENGKKVAEIALQTAREAIPYYIELLGMYPYSFLNILPGGPGVWGGYPFASGMVVIHGMQFFEKGSIRHWRWITAHEIGHEYWGEYVLDGDNPGWLWIAMGIYADREFSRYIGLSDWKHRGWAEQYLQGVKKGYNTTLEIRPSDEAEIDFDRNNYVIHAKGFSFISALELIMGKENFQSAYRATLESYGGDRLEYRDFQKICELHAGENLQWFFDPWVCSNKFLSATIGDTKSEKADDGYKSTVSVYHQGEIIMPVPVYAIFMDGSTQVKMTHRLSRKSILEFQSNSPLIGCTIDPGGYLANLSDPPQAQAEEIIKGIKMLSYTGNGEKVYRIYRKAQNLQPENIGEYWYKLGLALFDGGYFSESETAFRYAARYGPDEDRFINYCWLGHLQDFRGNRPDAIINYTKALEFWDNDSYTHSQYNMKVNKNWVEERLQSPFSLGKPLSW
ncbi:MAG: hypothetical protein KAR19_00010 [Bacteroidales bacterium]|nr:hypothetical protein [Bacteroidales bacterium]